MIQIFRKGMCKTRNLVHFSWKLITIKSLHWLPKHTPHIKITDDIATVIVERTGPRGVATTFDLWPGFAFRAGDPGFTEMVFTACLARVIAVTVKSAPTVVNTARKQSRNGCPCVRGMEHNA